MRELRVMLVVGGMDASRDGVADYTLKLLPHLRERGISAQVLTRPPGGWSARSIIGLACIARRRAADVLHVQYSPTAFDYVRWLGALPLLLRGRPPLVLTLHEYGWWPWHAPLPGGLRTAIPRLGERFAAWDRESVFLLTGSRAILTSSDGLRALLEERLGRLGTVRVVPVGTNIEPVTDDREAIRVRVRKRLGIPREAPVLAFFGFVRREKGVHGLVRAFARIAKDWPGARLLLIGGFDNVVSSGEETEAFRRETESLIGSLGLEQRVTLTGHLADVEVSECLQAADVGVLPFDEGVTAKSGTLMAMLAHELPTVVSRPPQPDWLVADGETVLAAEPGAPEQLADKVGRLLRHPGYARRLAAEGRARAERGSWHAIADAHRAAYEQVVERPG